MALKIKDSIILDNSLINDSSNNNINHPFNILKHEMEKSWATFSKEVTEGKNFYEKTLQKSNLNFYPDSIKNKSLITYINAPWGSGKTYFIEKFISWAKNIDGHLNKPESINNESKEELFKFNPNSPNPLPLKINLIDSWEIHNGKNISEILSKIFVPNVKDKRFIGHYKKVYYEIVGSKEKERKVKRNIVRFSFLASAIAAIALTCGTIGVGVVGLGAVAATNTVFTSMADECEIKNDKRFKNLTDFEKRIILQESIIRFIEDQNKNNDQLIIVDNIERLSSKNRLDVINKILNWANIGGTTYIFLTNFDKIKLTKEYEEDFWNKISLHETFSLSNSWVKYLENYSHNGFKFDESKKELLNFIKEILPSFFRNAEDIMDIREIKKLLNNWQEKNNKSLLQSELILSFTSILLDVNSKGLEKYFLINKIVSNLSEDYWYLWEKEFIKLFGKNEFLSIANERNINNPKNTSFIKNKMYRIQSNFFDIEMNINSKNELYVLKEKIKLKSTEIERFKSFNNFVDESSRIKFEKTIVNLLSTRKIYEWENSFLYYFVNVSSKKGYTPKYYEFKYNNIKKIFIYNKIFKVF